MMDSESGQHEAVEANRKRVDLSSSYMEAIERDSLGYWVEDIFDDEKLSNADELVVEIDISDVQENMWQWAVVYLKDFLEGQRENEGQVRKAKVHAPEGFRLHNREITNAFASGVQLIEKK